MRPKLLIPLVTLSLISIPMLIMSIRMKGFWINSQYDFPFVLIPAFLLGDPLLLPPLNYHIYLALKQTMPLIDRRRIFWTVCFSFLISTIFNSYTHYMWSHDAFTSFIDPHYGMTSMAGWWHYGVSILQITLAFTFGAVWLLTVKQQNHMIFKAFERAAYILITFSFVNMSGAFITKDLIFSRQLTPGFFLPNLIGASIPLFMEILFLIRMRNIYQLTQSGSTTQLEYRQ